MEARNSTSGVVYTVAPWHQISNCWADGSVCKYGCANMRPDPGNGSVCLKYWDCGAKTGGLLGLHGQSVRPAQIVNLSREPWRTSVFGLLKHPYKQAYLCAHMGPHTPLTAGTPGKLESRLFIYQCDEPGCH